MLNTSLFDSTIAYYVDLQRLSVTAQKTAIDSLLQMQKELIAQLSNADDPARIAQQLKESDAVIKRYYESIGQESQSLASGVVQSSAQDTSSSLMAATGQQVTAGLLPTNAVLESIATDSIIQGATQKEWWSRQAVDTAWRYQTQVRQGIVNGEKLGDIVARVKDVVGVSQRNAEALVRTSIVTVANEARQATYKENSDIIKGQEWVAALDIRTCPLCAIRDGKQWTLEGKPIGHSIPFQAPPIHFNDRCALIAVTKTPQELGIDVGELPQTLRASATGMTTDKTFDDWLKRQPKDKIEEVLGKGKADLWINGKVTFDQLFKNGKPLTLEQLNAKYTN